MAQSPGSNGVYRLHRIATGADDGSAFTDKDKGVNLAGYRVVLIQAIPLDTDDAPNDPAAWSGASVGVGASDPSFDVYVWSDAIGKFVLDASWTMPTVSAGDPVEVQYTVHGRIVMIGLTTAPEANESVAFLVSGADKLDPS